MAKNSTQHTENRDIAALLKKKKGQLFFKRFIDLFFSTLGLLVLLPIFLIIAIAIKIDSKGPVFFKQERVGKNGRSFKIFKFRTMVQDAEQKGMQLTTSEDERITKVGKFLRKTKIDELPQLINVLKGDMSLVGPRPEVPKYVTMYTTQQKQVLLVRPGITDIASIKFRNENDLLDASKNAEQTYIEEIMPQKLALNFEYIENLSVLLDFKLIFQTFARILRA